MFNAKITINFEHRADFITFHQILCFSYVNKNVKENDIANKHLQETKQMSSSL